MLVELGNHSAHRAIDEHPAVTTVHIPDADADGNGGYTHDHEDPLTPADFHRHRQEATDYRGGVTQLPGHEAALSVVNAWAAHAAEKPEWINVVAQQSPKASAEHLQEFLAGVFGCKSGKPTNVEDLYHTRFGPPGEGGPKLPDARALFTDDGRVQQANNYGGGQVGYTGQQTAATPTTLTCGAANWTVNQWAGYRVYAFVNASKLVWGNVLSNTPTALTVDRWYEVATPGGAAGATPSGASAFLIADGGTVSAWFVGLSTSSGLAPAPGDHTLAGEYAVAGGGFVRKVSPFSMTSGTSPMTYTLTPVFTGVPADTYPSTFYGIGVFCSMVVGAVPTMKFESLLNAPASVGAAGDQFTLTETVTGS